MNRRYFQVIVTRGEGQSFRKNRGKGCVAYNGNGLIDKKNFFFGNTSLKTNVSFATETPTTTKVMIHFWKIKFERVFVFFLAPT